MEGAQRIFLAGFSERAEGEAGGLRLRCTVAAAAAATRFAVGLCIPRLFVRRYRVPHALHSRGFEAGPRRHCGESVGPQGGEGEGGEGGGEGGKGR